ncbi:MAG: DUF6602 domain-containing protein [Bacteroidota bacterium]
MSNKTFDALIEEQIDAFKDGFVRKSRELFSNIESKELIHPGEFGSYREQIAKDYIKFFVPQRLDIHSGFIITSQDRTSTQCDIVIYDSKVTPLIQSKERHRFFPVETVVGIGEVKSVLSKTDFFNALSKLSKTKSLRSDIQTPSILFSNTPDIPLDIAQNPYTSMVSFIICQKLDFNLSQITSEITSYYELNNIAKHDRHNFILSIEDGIILYELSEIANPILFNYPVFVGKPLINKFIPIHPNKHYHHIKTFSMSLFDTLSSATIFYPAMVFYMSGYTPIDHL